jgi:hypothetical protein
MTSKPDLAAAQERYERERSYETVRPSRVSIHRRMNLGTRSQVSHNSRRSRGGNQAAT